MSQFSTSESSSPRSLRRAKNRQQYYSPGDNDFLEDLEQSQRKQSQRRQSQRKQSQGKLQKIRDLEEEVRNLSNELQDPWAQYHRVCNELRAATLAKDTLLAELRQRLEAQSNEAQATAKSTMSAMYALQAERDSARAELAQDRTQLQGKTSSLETVEVERDSAQAELEQAHTQLQEKMSSLETVEVERDSAQAELEQARTQLQEKMSSLRTVKAERDSVKVALRENTLLLKTIEAQRDFVQNELLEKTSLLESTKAALISGDAALDRMTTMFDQHRRSQMHDETWFPSIDWLQPPQDYQPRLLDFSAMDLSQPTEDFQLQGNLAALGPPEQAMSMWS